MQADAIVARFLRTGFEGGRHARRVGQISELDGSIARVGVVRRPGLIPSRRRDWRHGRKRPPGSDTRSAARLGIHRNP